MRRVEGVAVGLVTQIDAEQGRVKVSFPWMAPPQESNWAPIASLLAGKKRGVRFMPEKDDEALVAFDRGDFEHPYVVGFLYNGADLAPDDVKTNRLIVTPGKHELRFEDKDGDKRVVLKTAAGHHLTLDDKAGTVTLATAHGGTVTLTDTPGKVELEASGNKITIAPEGITIDVAAGTLDIRSSTAINVDASGPMNVNCGAAMTVLCGGAMSVEATGAISVQASVVTVTAGAVSVNAPLATFAGVLTCTTLVATSVVSSSYTPGVGNIW